MNAYRLRVAAMSVEQARELFYYDGKNLRHAVGKKAGQLAGNQTKRDKGYRQVRIGKDSRTGKTIYAQATHLIHLLEYGHFPIPGLSMDHKNGETFDDSRENLRPATARQQRANTEFRLNKDGLPLGSEIDCRGYWVSVKLGPFESKEDAIQAKIENNLARFGEYARPTHSSLAATADLGHANATRIVAARRTHGLNSTTKSLLRPAVDFVRFLLSMHEWIEPAKSY